MHSTALALAAVMLASGPPAAPSDRPLREARSDNGRFILKIEPAPPAQGARTPPAGETETEAPGDADTDRLDAPDTADADGRDPEPDPDADARAPRCRATLLERRGGGAPAVVWSAALVNEVAPAHAFIRDDGRYVVTLDEYRRGGAAHALVIYDDRGEIRREFALADLLPKSDRGRVRMRDDALEWLPGARFSFDDDGKHFVIRLRWGTTLRIDLETAAAVARDRAAADAHESDAAAELVAPPAQEFTPKEHGVSAILEALGLFNLLGAAALTDEPLDDPAVDVTPTSRPQDSQVTAASVPDDLAREPRAEADDAMTFSEPAADGAAASRGGGSDEPALEHRSAGNSASAGVPVPQPDPAAPVDYLAWINEQARTRGPSAASLLMQAAEAVHTFDGDPEVLRRALAGDPAAWLDPLLTSWLDSNQHAMNLARQAGALEYRGRPMSSESGRLWGVLLPNLAPTRELARAFVTHGRLLELWGAPQVATDLYADALQLGSQVGHGTTLIETLVGIAVQTMAAERVLDALANAEPARIDYGAVAARLEAAYKPVRPLSESIQFERAMMLDMLQASFEYDADAGAYRRRADESGFGDLIAITGDGNPLTRVAVELGLVRKGFRGIVEGVNRNYDELTEAARLPYPQAREAFQSVEQRIAGSGAAEEQMLLKILLPSLGKAHYLERRAESTRRATLLAARLHAFRQKHGAFPESLDSLDAGQIAVDPLSNQTFGYLRNEAGFELRSPRVDAPGDPPPPAGTSDGAIRHWPR